MHGIDEEGGEPHWRDLHADQCRGFDCVADCDGHCELRASFGEGGGYGTYGVILSRFVCLDMRVMNTVHSEGERGESRIDKMPRESHFSVVYCDGYPISNPNQEYRTHQLPSQRVVTLPRMRVASIPRSVTHSRDLLHST